MYYSVPTFLVWQSFQLSKSTWRLPWQSLSGPLLQKFALIDFWINSKNAVMCEELISGPHLALLSFIKFNLMSRTSRRQTVVFISMIQFIEKILIFVQQGFYKEVDTFSNCKFYLHMLFHGLASKSYRSMKFEQIFFELVRIMFSMGIFWQKKRTVQVLYLASINDTNLAVHESRSTPSSSMQL